MTCVLGAAALAPWVAGARTTLVNAERNLAWLLAAAFLAIVVDDARRGKWPRFIGRTGWCVVFLLGCVAWWATQPEPRFATAFAAEHWQFLEGKFPDALMQLPRAERLEFFAGVLLGFLAAADLGRSERFRRQLSVVLGLSGVAVALYAIGIRWLHWTTPPWNVIGQDTEQYNVTFFHHSGPQACVDVTWPLLLFRREWRDGRPTPAWVQGLIALIVAPIIATALPLWHSELGPFIASGLLAAGILWQFAPRLGWIIGPKTVLATAAALFGIIFIWQGVRVAHLGVEHADGWISAEYSQRTAPERDALLRAAADKRGDRFVASSTPPRPAAWITALRMTRDYPLVGLGPGAWTKRAILYSNDTIVNTFYEHRQFSDHDLLQTAAEWGGLGALAWSALWAGGFIRAARRDPLNPSREAGLLLALVAMGLHALSHFPLQDPALLLWTMLLVGIAWSPRSGPAAPSI